MGYRDYELAYYEKQVSLNPNRDFCVGMDFLIECCLWFVLVFCLVSCFMLHVFFLLVPHVLYCEASGLFDRALWLAIGGYAFRALREEVGIDLDYLILSCVGCFPLIFFTSAHCFSSQYINRCAYQRDFSWLTTVNSKNFTRHEMAP